MPTLKADIEACQGYGNGLTGARDTFDIDDDGKVVLLRTDVPAQDRGRIEEAACSCPVNALAMED